MLQWHFPFPLIHNLCPFPLSKRKHFTFDMTLNHLNMHKHVISGICMKEKIKAQSVMTGRSGIKVSLGNADTATFAQHSPLSRVTLSVGCQQHLWCKSRKQWCQELLSWVLAPFWLSPEREDAFSVRPQNPLPCTHSQVGFPCVV